ncbi:MAG: hypothetical protein ACM3TR_00685 [Caulobacteraceae bacterium]
MSENFLNSCSQNNLSRSKSALDLNLIQQERVGDTLFLIGTILAFISADQAENTIVQKPASQSSERSSSSPINNSAITIAIASWIFLIASIIFANVASTRLAEQTTTKASTETAADKTLIADQIAAFGSIVKVIGFVLVAIANQIKIGGNQDSTVPLS